jgi:hypothetical protein
MMKPGIYKLDVTCAEVLVRQLANYWLWSIEYDGSDYSGTSSYLDDAKRAARDRYTELTGDVVDYCRWINVGSML